jgi:hypothetical protein
MGHANLWRCPQCGDQTIAPRIIRGRAGGWRCRSWCRKCGAFVFHSKWRNWIEKRPRADQSNGAKKGDQEHVRNTDTNGQSQISIAEEIAATKKRLDGHERQIVILMKATLNGGRVPVPKQIEIPLDADKIDQFCKTAK